MGSGDRWIIGGRVGLIATFPWVWSRIGVGAGIVAVLVGLAMFACVFVNRDGTRPIVSLRKANSREVKRYGEKINQDRS